MTIPENLRKKRQKLMFVDFCVLKNINYLTLIKHFLQIKKYTTG